MATPVTEQLVLPLDMEVTPDAELTSEAASRTSVLITEAEVVFSTAAEVRHDPPRLDGGPARVALQLPSAGYSRSR